LPDDKKYLKGKNAFFALSNRDFSKNAFFFVEIIAIQRRGISPKRHDKRNHRDQEARCPDVPIRISNI
jgi:hypothetical protein